MIDSLIEYKKQH